MISFPAHSSYRNYRSLFRRIIPLVVRLVVRVGGRLPEANQEVSLTWSAALPHCSLVLALAGCSRPGAVTRCLLSKVVGSARVVWIGVDFECREFSAEVGSEWCEAIVHLVWSKFDNACVDVLRIFTMSRVIVFIVLLWGACGYVSSDIASEPPSLQDLQHQFAENFPEGLPPINASQVPSQEEAKELLKNKCERLAGPGAYERVESAHEDFKACVMSLVNVTELQEEMEAAKPTGDLDIVFRKYCQKSPIFKDCINNFTATFDPCLEDREKESKKIVQNITESLLGFICYKEGDRIALFIAEGGPECLQSKQEEIQHCANTTVSRYMPVTENAGSTLSQIPLLVLDEKECQSIQQFQECTVTSLEKCAEPTPANIVESLFQFIVKMTPCQNMKAYSSEPSVRSSAVPTIWRQTELFITTILLLTRFVA